MKEEKIGIRFLKYLPQIIVRAIFSLCIFIMLLFCTVFILEHNQTWVIDVQKYVHFDQVMNIVSYVQKFNINEDIEGNQFSLAGLYFSLAVGGTVIFSLRNHYLDKENTLIEKLLEQKTAFEEFYNENHPSLSLDLLDYVNSDSASMRYKKFDIEKDMKEDIKVFNTEILEFRKKVNTSEIENELTSIKRYKWFFYFDIVIYIIGIITIFVSKDYATVFLWVFFIISIIFGLSINRLYTDYIK